MNVAIVGLAPSSHPGERLVAMRREGWQLWGLPWDGWAPHYDQLFEMHDREVWEADLGPEYLTRLQELPGVIWMPRRHDDIPGSRVYPMADAIVMARRDYFGSSLAYMLVKAMLEGAEQIALHGAEIRGVYDHQRPNLEYLIGLALGQGIRVSVAEPTALLKAVEHPGRYGQRAT